MDAKNKIRRSIWKLIPVREEGGDWIELTNRNLLMLRGLYLETKDPRVTEAIYILQGVKTEEDFSLFRTMVFKASSLLEGVEEQ